MKLTKNKNAKTMRIKIEDTDDYDVTENNGVIFRPTIGQAKRIAKMAYSLDNMVLMS